MVKIKIAEEQDAVIVAMLGRITFTQSFGHLFQDKRDLYEYLDKTFSVEKIANGLVKLENKFWLATVNDLPVGYAKLKLNSVTDLYNSTNICQLQKIYVLNDFISMKIGLKLQNTLIETAKELGFEHIWLSVWAGNERAIKFYKKNTFNEIGNFEFQIGKEKFDFIKMLKKI